MKQVYIARDEAEAELALGYLQQREIEAIVQSGALGAIIGASSVNEAMPSLWVRDEDEARAAAVMAEFRDPPAPVGPPWVCPKCGETIEPQFSECWNCGTARPEKTDAT